MSQFFYEGFEERPQFISMRVAIPEVAHAILNGQKRLSIDGIYTLQGDLLLGRHIFIVLGGDAGKKEVDWERGFFGIAHVVREPYDIGYKIGNRSQEYFKIDIEVDCTFPLPVSREYFLDYRDAYDAAFIGPELHRDVTQAVCSLQKKKAIAVIRGVLDKMPEMEERFRQIFSNEFMTSVFGKVTKLIPTQVSYGQSDKEAIAEATRETSWKYDIEKTSEDIPMPYNRIIFGAPGTGKSYKVNSDRKKLFKEDGSYERVTFHPAYSYANFFGGYKPVGRGADIAYKYVPGPLLRTLLKALARPEKNYLLIIEEINRANVAATFGDAFQLLDRTDGRSEYPIDISDELKDFIKEYEEENGVRVRLAEGEKLYFPNNFYIWGTMNPADQGVMPLDTAFKRRWTFDYRPINEGENEVNDCQTELILDSGERKLLVWNHVRHTINNLLRKAGVNEDKWLGPFFLSMEVLRDSEQFRKMFESKVLMYLFEDAAKYNMRTVFGKEYFAYADLLSDFHEVGGEIFASDGE